MEQPFNSTWHRIDIPYVLNEWLNKNMKNLYDTEIIILFYGYGGDESIQEYDLPHFFCGVRIQTQ